MLSKVLEKILLSRLEIFIFTKDNQFGLKAKHGTDMCIFALKEIVIRKEIGILPCFYPFLMLQKHLIV